MSQLPSVLRFIAKIDAAHKIFRAILGTATPDQIFTQRRLLLSDDEAGLYENTANNRELSEAMLGVDFPRLVGSVDLEHYTSMQSLEGIVQSNAFYLQSVATQLANHEFTSFALDHNLNGYFDVGNTGQRIFKELSDDLFFLSLTDPGGLNSDHMWGVFGQAGCGVRMRLRVTPEPPADLRRMGYDTGAPTAFKRINDKLKSELGLVYTPWGLSRVCAFYLPSGYQPEMEVRLMIKRHEGGIDRTILHRGRQVWPIALVPPGGATRDPCCRIELVGIDVGPMGCEQAVRNAIDGTVYDQVPVRLASP